MPRPTTACLRLPEGLDVTWDRGVAHDDGSLFIYGWIEREYASALNGRAHEILVLQFDRTGQMVWWITSSAAWSQKLWDYFAEEGEHIDCLPWRVAIYQAGATAKALPVLICTCDPSVWDDRLMCGGSFCPMHTALLQRHQQEMRALALTNPNQDAVTMARASFLAEDTRRTPPPPPPPPAHTDPSVGIKEGGILRDSGRKSGWGVA